MWHNNFGNGSFLQPIIYSVPITNKQWLNYYFDEVLKTRKTDQINFFPIKQNK